VPIKRLFSTLTLAIFAASPLLNACAAGAKVDPIKGYESQSRWIKRAQPMPIIEAGQHRENSFWNDPAVIKDGDNYVMYMTTSLKEPWKPPVAPFRAVSKDGINWTLDPKKPLLSPKETDFVSNETPSVIKFKGKYHMYYTGLYKHGEIPSMAIGHAVSEDGITWVNDNVPILEATGDWLEWNGYLVGEPGAVVFKGKVYLYYTAMGARLDAGKDKPHQLQTIGLVTSTDGRKFDKQRRLINQSDTYPPEKGFVGYSTPSAITHKGKIHLVFDVAMYDEHNDPQWQQVAIHHAVSSDGLSFVEDGKPILTRDDFSWTSGEVIGPTMLISGNKVKLWWSGHVKYSEFGDFVARGMKGPEHGIGYAELPLEKFIKD
jgi:predicted GH43/DUF377 family glycosyl hydrolase